MAPSKKRTNANGTVAYVSDDANRPLCPETVSNGPPSNSSLVQRLFTKEYLTVDQVPEQYKERFIYRGYRQPYSSVLDCIVSTVRPNNETLNIWTHLVPFLVLFAYFWTTFPSTLWPLSDIESKYYPLLSLEISICAYLLCSSMAHLFNCMTPQVRHSCFYFDYVAISLYGIGGSCSTFYYLRPLNTGILLFDSPNLFMFLCALSCLATCYINCASRHKWESAKYVVRTLAFMLPFFCGNSPVFYRFLECVLTKQECSRGLAYCFAGWTFYFVSAILNATRVPERYYPRTFDIVGHNHQWVHVITTCGTVAHFCAVMNDIVEREEVLEDQLRNVTFASSLGCTIGILVLNSAIALYFRTQLTPSGHLKDKEKDL